MTGKEIAGAVNLVLGMFWVVVLIWRQLTDGDVATAAAYAALGIAATSLLKP